MLGFVQQEMAHAAKQAVVFGVLKACLTRRYVLPEVYDVMDKVGGLLVQSPSIPVRQQCASVLLQFLLVNTRTQSLQRCMMLLFLNRG